MRTDVTQPCGRGSAGGWSVRGLLLDGAGVAVSSAAVVGLAAAVPRSASSTWTAAGANTLSVYLVHVYVLPALDMPLAALTQAAAFFTHPEAAAPVALLACLFIVRGLAFPLALPAFRVS